MFEEWRYVVTIFMVTSFSPKVMCLSLHAIFCQVGFSMEGYWTMETNLPLFGFYEFQFSNTRDNRKIWITRAWNFKPGFADIQVDFGFQYPHIAPITPFFNSEDAFFLKQFIFLVLKEFMIIFSSPKIIVNKSFLGNEFSNPTIDFIKL